MAGTPYSATALYGSKPSLQPTPTGTPTHAATNQPEPFAKTVGTPAGASFGNPVFLLVVILGIAFGLIHFSVRVGG